MLYLSFFCVKYNDMVKERFINEVVPLRPKLLNYAFRFIKNKDESEDIVQEVLLKLYEMRDALDQYNSILALSTTMTKNLCLNRLRDNKEVYSMEYASVITCDLSTPEVQLENKDSVSHIMNIIERLPNTQQAILKMKHVEGLSVQEIAELTGSRADTVRVNLSRARKQVLNHFTKIQDHDRKI